MTRKFRISQLPDHIGCCNMTPDVKQDLFARYPVRQIYTQQGWTILSIEGVKPDELRPFVAAISKKVSKKQQPSVLRLVRDYMVWIRNHAMLLENIGGIHPVHTLIEVRGHCVEQFMEIWPILAHCLDINRTRTPAHSRSFA